MMRTIYFGDTETTEPALEQPTALAPCDVGKAQWIRIADVVAIGPLMVAGGLALRKKTQLGGYALIAAGLGTIVLNGANYVRFGRQFNLWV